MRVAHLDRQTDLRPNARCTAGVPPTVREYRSLCRSTALPPILPARADIRNARVVPWAVRGAGGAAWEAGSLVYARERINLRSADPTVPSDPSPTKDTPHGRQDQQQRGPQGAHRGDAPCRALP
ncbi:hypothetical protein SBD_2905 [Streptomyces bottropensis ATCC 25435]|uniref:Uncharacterized protein n=1 Tax=Streptomyces bottropensis ATCC 25435 TaxID=1054862 RepID=M3DFX2_9ACTN|nr:hypothetical protein SBD_2905 [Streptomyces bottropensis ATCC 25435]